MTTHLENWDVNRMLTQFFLVLKNFSISGKKSQTGEFREIAQNPYQMLIKLACCRITAAATAHARPMGGGRGSKRHALSLTLTTAATLVLSKQHAAC